MHIPISVFKLRTRADLKTFAYVGVDPSVFPSAYKGLDLVHGIPAYKHPFFEKWKFSQAQTRKMAAYKPAPMNDWTIKTATEVCKMRSWDYKAYEAPRGYKRGRYNTIGNIATRKEGKIKTKGPGILP